MAWGLLRFFAASFRARPAARTSPPSGAGLGVGAPAGLGRGIRLTGVGSTRNDLNPEDRSQYNPATTDHKNTSLRLKRKAGSVMATSG